MTSGTAAATLAAIGNTPMVELRNLDTGPCRLFGKLEQFNPGGSVKDRIALGMVEAAERDGRLKPGGTIVEATSGNTGIGLALVAALKGYRMILVIPDKMSREKIQHGRALGAEVIVTRTDVPPGHPLQYQTMADEIAARTPGALYIRQHYNPDNPAVHEASTGPEIWDQMAGDVDAIVGGIGTAGTMTGLGRYFRKVAPDLKMILADPAGSLLAPYVQTGELTEPGAWVVEGIGEDELPPVGDMSLIDEAIIVGDRESLTAARGLLKAEGIMGGSSTGTIVAAAVEWCRRQTEPKRVVAIIPDSGDKYLSKMYDDHWMADQGFIERESYGDLRDLIARRHDEHEDITVPPDATLAIALGKMRLANISQLPVVQDERVIGLIDESDLLQRVLGNTDMRAAFSDLVATAMTANLETLPPDASLSDVKATFDKGFVALIRDENQYWGLVTRTDLLNWLRRNRPAA